MQIKSILCVGIVIGACNPQIDLSTTDVPTTSGPSYLCVPGESIECGCVDGLEGAQVCQNDGQSFEECVCEEVENDSTSSTGNPSPDSTSSMGDSSSTGEDICQDGQIETCACDIEKVGTKVCTDTNEWGDCFCPPPTIPDYPGYQWILRNKNGGIVNAIFEPQCFQDPVLECSLTPHEKDLPCVRIQYLNGNPLGALFEVPSGDPLSCYHENKDFSGYFFDNPSCTGTPYSGVPFGFMAKTLFERVQNKLYWADFSSPPKTLQQYYTKDAENCIEQPLNNYPVYAVKEAPPTVYGLFPNSPYSISLE